MKLLFATWLVIECVMLCAAYVALGVAMALWQWRQMGFNFNKKAR